MLWRIVITIMYWFLSLIYLRDGYTRRSKSPSWKYNKTASRKLIYVQIGDRVCANLTFYRGIWLKYFSSCCTWLLGECFSTLFPLFLSAKSIKSKRCFSSFLQNIYGTVELVHENPRLNTMPAKLTKQHCYFE